MTVSDILDGVLDREGGWRDQVTRPDGSIDPSTNHGITYPTLLRYREQYLGVPPGETTLQHLRDLTADEAKIIYGMLFVQEPGFTSENVLFEPLRVQLIDFGVNSGQERAVRWLQRVIGATVTSQIDAQTRERISLTVGDWQGFDQTSGRLVNDALAAARCRMIAQAVAAGHINKADERGLVERALSFVLVRS